MRFFLSDLKKKITLALIPYLVRYKAYNLLSLLFVLNLSKIKSILPKKKTKFKVIVLSKSGGLDDIIESQKKYNNSFLYLACPRIFIKTIFNTIFGNQASNNLKFFSNQLKIKRDEYENFLVDFLKILKKKYNISAFIGFNYEFKGEIELAKASEKLKIPFLLLFKESVLTGIEEKYLRHVLKKIQKINNYKIAVYSDYAKKIFTETNFTDKDKIDVVGCSRLSKSISFKKKLPKNQILYYAIENRRGLADPYIKYYGDKFFDDLKEHKQYNSKNNWNFLHIKTLKILKKFAIKNPEISIIIKIKTGQSQNIKQYYNLPKNIKLQYYGPGHQLLEESKVIIAWNTTAILEGIAANRFILLPYFISKNNNINKDSELALKLKNENYGYSENDFYKKLDLFVKKEFKINQINNNQYQLKYHLANADNKACLRLNRFLIKNIK
jgi:hypothetical protein